VIVRLSPRGEVLETVRVDNDPVALSLELAKAGPDRRGTGIGRVAAARKLLTLVYYGLRDGQVRCLAPAPRQAM
jgi:hypothetical protein